MTPAAVARIVAHLDGDSMVNVPLPRVSVSLAPVARARALREAVRVLEALPDAAQPYQGDPLAARFAQTVSDTAQGARKRREPRSQGPETPRIAPHEAVDALRRAYAAWCDASLTLEQARGAA